MPPGLEIWGGTRLRASMASPPVISPLLRDLHWLRVPERIKFRLAVLVFRCRNQTAPNYLATGERPTVGRHGRLAETTAIGDNSEAARASHTTTNDRGPRLRRCCTARLERSACRHRFCTITGHFQAALKDSSVWTIVRLTTDLVTCPYVRINIVVNNSNNNNIFILFIQALRPN